MSSNIKKFQFGAHAVRIIDRAGSPWWVAADVCGALGVAVTHSAVGRLDDDEKGRDSITTPGGEQEVLVINESGLYSLVLSSKKPEAKAFKKWITSEVLPSIRKTGSYSAAPASTDPLPAPPAPADIEDAAARLIDRMVTAMVGVEPPFIPPADDVEASVPAHGPPPGGAVRAGRCRQCGAAVWWVPSSVGAKGGIKWVALGIHPVHVWGATTGRTRAWPYHQDDCPRYHEQAHAALMSSANRLR